MHLLAGTAACTPQGVPSSHERPAIPVLAGGGLRAVSAAAGHAVRNGRELVDDLGAVVTALDAFADRAARRARRRP